MAVNFDILSTINTLKENHLRQITALLGSLASIADKFQEKNKSKQPKPFNIILAASGKYYHENYHSDIMAYMLKNDENAIKCFINYINANAKSDLQKIDINNFRKTEIVREENRIDILIRETTDNSRPHCIIVENKIYDAKDMTRQLPRYYEAVQVKHTVDRIVYFSLDGRKPLEDLSKWSDEDRELLDKQITFVAAANGSDTDFIKKVLIPCKNSARSEQEKSFYCQYIGLLKYLRRNQMNDQLMKDFYEVILKEENYKSAVYIKEMMDALPNFRLNCIYDRFKYNHAPFAHPETYANDIVFRGIAPNETIEIKILTKKEEDYLSIMEFSGLKSKTESDIIEPILKEIGEEPNFTKKGMNHYVRTFKFPEEDEVMYKYLEGFLKKLRERIVEFAPKN